MDNYSKPGLVGRMVTLAVKRDGREADEICEVMACMAAGEYGDWRILVATHDGTLLATGASMVRLVADPNGRAPYR